MREEGRLWTYVVMGVSMASGLTNTLTELREEAVEYTPRNSRMSCVDAFLWRPRLRPSMG